MDYHQVLVHHTPIYCTNLQRRAHQSFSKQHQRLISMEADIETFKTEK